MPDKFDSAVNKAPEVLVQEILRAISQLQYGSVEISVHAGRVTQIERREKIRFVAIDNK